MAKKLLIDVVGNDYPEATKINVSFPDIWELIMFFQREDPTQGDITLYVAGFEPSLERTRANQFLGLSAKINRSLGQYRQYRLFQPWPTPIIPVVWDTQAGQGQVVKGGRLEVQLRPLGHAQVWTTPPSQTGADVAETGKRFGVLWECYLNQSARQEETWRQELAVFWQAVEDDMGVDVIFTHPHDPAYAEGYTEFLSDLGYGPDSEFEKWWSKGER